MEIRHLRYFVAMAETGSLMKASERLHVAQPALSVHLSNLEAQLGTTLLTRSSRGVELTPDGAFLYERATSLLRYHQESLSMLKDRKSKPRGRVSVGLLSTMPSLLVPELYRRVRAQLPDVCLYIVDASTSALFEWLQEGQIDLVTLFNLPETPELEATPLFCEAYYLVGQPTPGVGGEEIDFGEVLNLPLAIPSSSTTWRKVLDAAAERSGHMLTPAMETESAQALRALALSGQCYAIMPRSYIQSDLDAGLLSARRIVNPEMQGMMSLVSLASRPLGPAQAAVRDLLAEVVSDLCSERNLAEPYPPSLQLLRTTPSSLFPQAQARRRSERTRAL